MRSCGIWLIEEEIVADLVRRHLEQSGRLGQSSEARSGSSDCSSTFGHDDCVEQCAALGQLLDALEVVKKLVRVVSKGVS